jgi:hypothetical protein
LIIS